MAEFFWIMTNVGLAKRAAAEAGGTAIDMRTGQFAVGDGNGDYYEPDPEQTELVNETWRGGLNRVYINSADPTLMVCEALIPISVGGWDIREAGIIDADGDLIAVGKYPLVTKPNPSSGAARAEYVRGGFRISNGGETVLTFDDSLVMATQEELDNHAALTDPHQSTSLATANRLMLRDGNGRAQVNVPSAGADIARLDTIQAYAPHVVRAVATQNLSLSGAATADFVSLATGDRVLCAYQTNAVQNGIYIVNTSGAWTRSADADSPDDFGTNMLVLVSEGTVNADSIWMLTNNTLPTIGTSSISFTRVFPDEKSRTIMDAFTPTSDSGSPSTLMGWLANMIKQITGKTSWRTSPDTNLSSIRQEIYYVGCVIYNTVNPANPATYLGFGTWAAFGAGRFILGAGGGYNAGQTGGAATHTLTVDELPAHNHANGIYNRLLRPPYVGSLTGNDTTGSGGEQAVGVNDSADIETVGGSASHNNMPPFIVAYAWTRTA